MCIDNTIERMIKVKDLKHKGMVMYAKYFEKLYSEFKGSGIVYKLRNNGDFDDCYSVYNIKKKNGGLRLITVPNPELKSVQKKLSKLFERALIIKDSKQKSYILSDGNRYLFQTGNSSYGFEKKKSILMNAQKHASSKYFFKTDIHHFFDSFDYVMVKKTVHEAMKINAESFKNQDIYNKTLSKKNKSLVQFVYSFLFANKKILSKEYLYEDYITSLLCYHGKLATGSPASPALSNLYMRSFDRRLEVWLKNQEIKTGQSYIYTRYADDICISSDKRIPEKVGEYVGKLLDIYGLEMNKDKTLYQSNKSKNVITGINVTPEGNVTVGRRKKEELKKMLYDYLIATSGLNDDFNIIEANVRYVFHVEPEYCFKIVMKYIELSYDALAFVPLPFINMTENLLSKMKTKYPELKRLEDDEILLNQVKNRLPF